MNPQPLSTSESDWLHIRDDLRRRRFTLSEAAASATPEVPKVAGTPLLTKHEWIPTKPIPLNAIDIRFVDQEDRQYPHLLEAAKEGLPSRTDGSLYGSYAEAIQNLAAPAIFENRSTYRLVDADLASHRPVLSFGRGSYFDSINTGEAAAHEFAAAARGMPTGSHLRSAIGNPCDLTRRPANLAISTLTVRRGASESDDKFLLHWRDPAKVGHAGGMYQVVPVGVFQPSGEAAWNWRNDFSLWRGIVRELAEELGGASEDYGSENAPIDYGQWEFASRLAEASSAGKVQTYCLGLGVDPLTYATDLMTAIVIDAHLFDELFGEAVGDNNEGHVLDMKPFTSDGIARAVADFQLQAAGEAALRLASQLALVQA